MHNCYLLTSLKNSKNFERIYIGYTTDFFKRLKQHNGILAGGAKKTLLGRPWEPVIVISGFYDNHSALRFEFRWQRNFKKKFKKTTYSKGNIRKAIDIMYYLIKNKDGKINEKKEWGNLEISFFKKGYF